MNDILILWLPLSISSAALVGLVAVLVAVVRSREDQRKLLAVLEQLRTERAASDKSTSAYNEQLDLLRKQLAGVLQQAEAAISKNNALEQQLTQEFEKVSHWQTALEQQVLQQQEAIQEVADQDPESKFYQRAARLVQQGASLEEVMEACEIPRAEAELLYSLYKK